MILTITLNPSMDFIYKIDNFKLGGNNRTKEPIKMPGGKGINCTRALMNLNANVLAYTILGGENGDIIQKHLIEEQMPILHKYINGNSRNAYTIMHNNGIQTEIVENGPFITEDESNQIIDEVLDILTQNTEINIVTINGSINNGDGMYYVRFLSALRERIDRDLKIIMDLSKESLKNIVYNSEHSPDFIKPNELEFAELFGKSTMSKDEILTELKNNSIMIPYILVSLGGDGAVAKFNGNIYDVSIPKINLVNPTGSGDSTVAGAAYAFDNGYPDQDILKQAMACGIANALEEGVGVVSKYNVDALFDKIIINSIS